MVINIYYIYRGYCTQERNKITNSSFFEHHFINNSMCSNNKILTYILNKIMNIFKVNLHCTQAHIEKKIFL